MPYLICPACRLEAYSAARYATSDRCPRCDASFAGAERADGILHRWKATDPRLTSEQPLLASAGLREARASRKTAADPAARGGGPWPWLSRKRGSGKQ